MTNEQAHSTSAKTYLLVFAALIVLTCGTAGLAYLHLPFKVALCLASLIALAKCSLIMAFFMHLRFEGKAIYAVFFTALFLVAVLVLAILPDIGFLPQ